MTSLDLYRLSLVGVSCNDVMTVRRAALILGVSRSRVYQLLDGRGRGLEGWHIRGRWYPIVSSVVGRLKLMGLV